MAVSYKKLWKLLIDRDLKKKDLEAMAQVSHYTMSKLTHGDNVTTDVLGGSVNPWVLTGRYHGIHRRVIRFQALFGHRKRWRSWQRKMMTSFWRKNLGQ